MSNVSVVPAQKPLFGFVDLRRKERTAAPVRMEPLHEAPVRGSDLPFAGAWLKTKDLVGLFFAQGTRSRRTALPRTRVLVDVFTPTGRPAVEISFD